MRLCRVYAPVELAAGEDILVAGNEAHHLLRVMRLRPGQEFVVFNGTGAEARATVLAERGDCLEARVQSVAWPPVEAACRLTVYLSLVKGERFDWAVEKLTELGVERIVPLISEYTQAKSVSGERVKRWQRMAAEAAGQSHRVCVPTIAEPIAFVDALPSMSSAPAVMCVCGVPEAWPAVGGEMSLFIGPEGGFSEDEVAQARVSGCVFAGLGPRVLRVETAAVVASARILLFG